jgi:hypothetical protein
MDTQTVEFHLRSGKSVKISLDQAKVVSTKIKSVPISNYRSIKVKSLVVVDPKYGAVYISSSSDKIFNADFGDTLTGKILLTGLGDRSEKYDTPIKFSKVIRGKEGELFCKKSIDN